jgi:CDP-glucose 4,6-dehydratase
MHFLITGHTGFKGTWLALMLANRGHEVSGVSLNPLAKSLFSQLNAKKYFNYDFRCDIRNVTELEKCLGTAKPEVVIHFAAQPLVLESYKNPELTFDTNVMGTMNTLKAIGKTDSVKASLIVTTDKVYKESKKQTFHIETDQLGGNDPYSASKSMADLLTQSWVASFDLPPTGIARAGNVIGGGDSTETRLLPEIIANHLSDREIRIRHPLAIRPWQHVLDCLNGYTSLIDFLLAGGESGVWNFGPNMNEIKRVTDVIDEISAISLKKVNWIQDKEFLNKENELLLLDSNKARQELNWSEKLSFSESVRWTYDWYESIENGISPLEITLQNIKRFETLDLM